ncbi:hypothetical protein E2C01_049248 [Portunus trituberculatus]|uniref:Uncharacterized protein n=1 Tax=Portunus trituberculatus TaxID=210409 RepID=A0A5B7GCM2_PORTR|nr:hypothetical protein [Portunus trituberculatus]
MFSEFTAGFHGLTLTITLVYGYVGVDDDCTFCFPDFANMELAFKFNAHPIPHPKMREETPSQLRNRTRTRNHKEARKEKNVTGLKNSRKK